MFLESIPDEVKFAAQFIFPEESYNLLFADNTDQRIIGFVSFVGKGIKGFEYEGKNYLTLFENRHEADKVSPVDRHYFIADTEYITMIFYPTFQSITAGQKTRIRTTNRSNVTLNEDG